MVLVVIYQVAFPHTAVLGKLANSSVYRNIKQYPDAQMCPGILAFRIGEQPDKTIGWEGKEWRLQELSGYLYH